MLKFFTLLSVALSIANCFFLEKKYDSFIGPMRDVTHGTGLTLLDLHGRLQVSNGKITNKYGVPVALNGMSMFWSNMRQMYWNEDLINWLVSDWKVQVVRAPMAVVPDERDDTKDNYYKNPKKEAAKVATIVDACIKNGVYVIIDWHITDDLGLLDPAK